MRAMGYETVIGLEVHAQLKTGSKLFCNCSTRFGGNPNTHTCPVCLGMPGALPVLNGRAIEFAIRFGLAIDNDPEGVSIFARKNYFYPDLPKGYQISQFENPVVGKGTITVELDDGAIKTIGVTRAHLEEDAGQSAHDGWPQSRSKSYVNLNRSGIPLLEIVSEPDIRSADEAYAYLVELKSILQYLDICDGNMEEGSLRCDANVSVRPIGQEKLGTRTEIKNLNSFHNVKRAIQHEVHRQITLCTQGEPIQQCTLLWDVDTQTTRVMRTKEDSEDYRYFPEPDLPPLVITRAEVETARQLMPELPRARYLRFRDDYGLSELDARQLVHDKQLADYYEEAASTTGNPKAVANWIMSELLRELKTHEGDITSCPIAARQLADLIRLIDNGTISGKIAKEVFTEMFRSGRDPGEIVASRGLTQITDQSELERVVNEILAENPSQVADYKAGKTKIFGYFVGQAMKITRGKANPDLINQLLIERLD